MNKLNNTLVQKSTFKALLYLIFIGNIYTLQAQDRIPFDQGKKYILGDVTVTGKITFNEQTVVTFTKKLFNCL